MRLVLLLLLFAGASWATNPNQITHVMPPEASLHIGDPREGEGGEATQESVAPGGCDAASSRAARHVLEEFFLPKARSLGFSYPAGCPIDPAIDRLREMEKRKLKVRSNYFKCGICSKGFRSEEFLDQHMAARHPEVLGGAGTACLSDYCDALHCDHVRVDPYGYHQVDTRPKFKCDKEAAASHQSLCQRIAETCFPPGSGATADRLRSLFSAQFCAAHTCDHRHRRPFRLGRLDREYNPLMIIALIFSIIILTAVWIFIALYKGETGLGSQGDLRRIRNQKGVLRVLLNWWGAKEKRY